MMMAHGVGTMCSRSRILMCKMIRSLISDISAENNTLAISDINVKNESIDTSAEQISVPYYVVVKTGNESTIYLADDEDVVDNAG